jgi:hypothetical protein
MKRALFILVLLAGSAVAQDFEKAKKEFREAVLTMSESGVRSAAEMIAKSDNREAVDVLLDGYGLCAGQIKQLWVEKLKWMKEVERYKNFEVDWSKNPPIVKDGDVAEYKKWLEASQKSVEVEKKIMSVEAVKAEIVAALAKFKSDGALKELINKFKNESSWGRRAGVAEALGKIATPECVTALVDRLKADSEPGVKVAILDALRSAGAKTPEVIAGICDQLKNEYWQVKSTAAQTLRALGSKDAIEPLIDALKGVEGRLKEDFNDALVALAGVNKHGDYGAWKAWWDGNKEQVKGGSYKPAPGEAAGGQDGKSQGTTFYGVPVKSKNVVFVLDRSGSMAEPSEWELPPDVASGGAGDNSDLKPEGKRKIDIARWQLRRCVKQLPNGTEFNIIYFSHDWQVMSEKMVTMGDGTRKTALAFVEKLEPQGGTNVFDPMEKAFSFSGGADKVLKGSVDTIFLMTDGLPNAGQVPAWQDIVKKIKEMNKTKKITIHTIGTFSTGANPEEGAKFLEQLATENNGTFTSAMKNGGSAKDGKKK